MNIYQNNEVDFKLVQLINLHKHKKLQLVKFFLVSNKSIWKEKSINMLT